MQAAKVVEECLDAELKRLDNLDADDIDEIRRKRIQQLKNQAGKREEWIAKGHGKYDEIAEEKEFFEEAKNHERIVCHFYRDSTMRCKIVDKHLQILAPKHLEAKFLRINAEKAMFLCQRLKVKVLPTIVLISDGKTKDFIVGFDDLGGIDDFPTEMLEWRLGVSEIIDYKGERPTLKGEEKTGVLKFAKRKEKKTIRGGGYEDDDDDDDDEY